jgi:[ribosomal protein S5]-alanine N-acetyltransferase
LLEEMNANISSRVVAETDRLRLRTYVASDHALLYPIVSDPITRSFYPAPFSAQKAQEWIERSLASYGEHGYGRYAVELRENGAYVGCVGLFNTEVNGNPEIDLGYILDKVYWGKGYAVEAARACVELARAAQWGDRIVVQMADDNERSWKVAERLGAKLESTFYNAKNRGFLTRLYVINPLITA